MPATDKPMTWLVASRCSAVFSPKPDHLDDRQDGGILQLFIAGCRIANPLHIARCITEPKPLLLLHPEVAAIYRPKVPAVEGMSIAGGFWR